MRTNERGYRIGEDHQRARYTDHEVELVHALRDMGMSMREISDKLEMPVTTVWSFLSGRCRCQTMKVA
jgi:hypothetical protein